jgi:hypothetical protein
LYDNNTRISVVGVSVKGVKMREFKIVEEKGEEREHEN